MIRHRSGKFKARPARVAAPLAVARCKSPAHVRGAATRAERQRERVLAVAAVLRAEARSHVEAF